MKTALSLKREITSEFLTSQLWLSRTLGTYPAALSHFLTPTSHISFEFLQDPEHSDPMPRGKRLLLPVRKSESCEEEDMACFRIRAPGSG
jgi:hypothetical protein